VANVALSNGDTDYFSGFVGLRAILQGLPLRIAVATGRHPILYCSRPEFKPLKISKARPSITVFGGGPDLVGGSSSSTSADPDKDEVFFEGPVKDG
jgi:hypothetical protein